MNRFLELRSKRKRSPLSSFVTHHNPIFIHMKICMKKRDRMVSLTYDNRSGDVRSGKDIYSISYIKAPLHWLVDDEPVEIKFRDARTRRDIIPMSKMSRYSSICIYH